MNFCKHFDHVFNKWNVSNFMNDTGNFIPELGKLIAQRCKHFFQFNIEKTGIGKNPDVCKWKVVSSSIEIKNLKLFKTGCGCDTSDYKTDDINNKLCLNCGKKIEVVE